MNQILSQSEDYRKATAQKTAAFLISEEFLGFLDYHRPYIFPERDRLWKEWEFVVNPTEGTYDALIVYQSTRPLNQTYQLRVPPTRTLLVMLEPPEIVLPADGYTNQFHTVISQIPNVKCANPLLRHSAHHWFLERPLEKMLDVSDLQKSREISMVISNKQDQAGHRQRWKLAIHLQEHFGDRIDWFGRGVHELDRKCEGLYPYRYHIALENTSRPHYWTEKLADAYVANCFPFYWGDPRVTEDFPEDSLIQIDPNDPEHCIQLIEKALKQDLYGKRQDALAEARRKLADEYHPYETYRQIWNSVPDSMPKSVTIRPDSEFRYTLTQKLRFKAQKLFSRNAMEE